MNVTRKGVLLLPLVAACLYAMGCGGGSSTAVPTITTQPTSQTVTAPSSVTLSVVSSDSSATYQWYKDNVAIESGTSASLTINPTTTANSGSYFVVVTNSGGSTTSDTVTLTVTSAASSGSSTVTVN
ncbi:MAG: immunoglobulin domain-containing protein [Armatimonas sp.]